MGGSLVSIGSIFDQGIYEWISGGYIAGAARASGVVVGLVVVICVSELVAKVSSFPGSLVNPLLFRDENTHANPPLNAGEPAT